MQQPKYLDSYEILLMEQKPPMDDDFDVSDIELALEEGEALVYTIKSPSMSDTHGYESVPDAPGIVFISDDEDDQLPQPSTSETKIPPKEEEQPQNPQQNISQEAPTVEAQKLPEFSPDFSQVKSNYDPNFGKQQKVMLIDFDDKPNDSEKTEQDDTQKNTDNIDLLLGIEENNDNKSQADVILSFYETNKPEFVHRLLNSDDSTLSKTLFKLVQNHPDCGDFLLTVIQGSGVQARRLITNFPPLSPSKFTDYLEQRKKFALSYTQFEGNFSLAEFTKTNRACPPPPGEPPICLDAVKQLQQAMDTLIFAFREKPSKLLLNEALSLYQIIAYIIAKLVQFNISKGYVQSTIIPCYQNQHNNLKKAFDASKLQINFPAASFNFEDQNIIKRLRPPPSKVTFV